MARNETAHNAALLFPDPVTVHREQQRALQIAEAKRARRAWRVAQRQDDSFAIEAAGQDMHRALGELLALLT